MTWLIPHRIAERLGDVEFSTLRTLTLDNVRRLMTEPTSLHRFKNRMSVSFFEGVQRIANMYDGDASRIWSDRPPCYEVVSRFRQFHEVGQKIAAMAVLILVREFKIVLPDLPSLPIAPDVHVCRVFSRLGLTQPDAQPDEVAERARSLHPQFPGMRTILLASSVMGACATGIGVFAKTSGAVLALHGITLRQASVAPVRWAVDFVAVAVRVMLVRSETALIRSRPA